MSIRINVLGDFCPIGKLADDQARRDSRWLGDLRYELTDADFNIVNLECPLTNSNTKILKSGPNLKADPRTIDVLKQASINVVTLANNHIMDYGEQGLIDTLELLGENGIAYAGVGTNLREATKPLVLKKDSLKIAILSICEQEFSIASPIYPGAAPIDIVENYITIRDLKDQVDHIILIVHGGIENYAYPTPLQIKTYRFFAELGVSAVIGHHSHCPQPFELYMGVPIFYGIGNFVFDEDGNPDSWDMGLSVSMDISKDLLSIRKIFRFHVDYKALTITSEQLPKASLDEDLNIDEALCQWDKLCAQENIARSFINSLTNASFLTRVLNKIIPSQIDRSIRLQVLNMLRNSSLHELLVNIYRKKLERE